MKVQELIWASDVEPRRARTADRSAAIHEVVVRTMNKGAINEVGAASGSADWRWPTSGPVWSMFAGRPFDRTRDA